MPGNAHMLRRWILIWTVLCLVAWASALAVEPDAPSEVRVNVNLISPDGEAVVALPRSRLRLLLNGPPAAHTRWALSYAANVLATGEVDLDKDGRAALEIVLPSVRHRTVCDLSARTNDMMAHRQTVILPEGPLVRYAAQIAELDFGVIDGAGRAQAALKDEGVVHRVLSGDLQKDFFTGGVLIVAGLRDPDALTRECTRIESRLRKGMVVVVLDPPVGWERWGVKVVGVEKPLAVPAVMAEDMCAVMASDDLGDGPWRVYLDADETGKALVWLKAPPAGARQDSGGQRPLLVARAVGKGIVLVGVLPQLGDPARDPVGRGMLNEMILWVLSREQANLAEETGP